MTRRIVTNTAFIEAYATDVRHHLEASSLGAVRMQCEKKQARVTLDGDGGEILSVTFKIRRRPCGLEFVTATILREGDVYQSGHVEHDGHIVQGRLFVLNAHPLYDQKAALLAAIGSALADLTVAEETCRLQADVDQVKADLEAAPEVACDVIEHLMATRPDIVPEVAAAVTIVQERRGLLQRMFVRPSFLHA